MNRTPIEWCRSYAQDGSFEEGFSVNPIRFRPKGATRLTTMCQKVSPGCAHCYAEGITRRFWPKDAAAPFPGYTALGVVSGEFVLDEKTLLSVLKRKKPARVFWGDMTDLFQESVPDEFLDRCFAVAALTPHLTHMFLTKRPERMHAYFNRRDRRAMSKQVTNPAAWFVWSAATAIQAEAKRPIPSRFTWTTFDEVDTVAPWPLPNVWLGTSVENQEQADKRIPLLLQTPAAVRFISAEPLLGAVNLNIRWLPNVCDLASCRAVSEGLALHERPCSSHCVHDEMPLGHLDWVIVGGESGAGARPMHPDWARSLRDQCKAANVPFFFKQWGEWIPWEPDGGFSEWKSQTGKLMDRHAFPDMKDARVITWTDACLHDGDDICVHQRVGTKAAGCLLDAVGHHEFPAVSA